MIPPYSGNFAHVTVVSEVMSILRKENYIINDNAI